MSVRDGSGSALLKAIGPGVLFAGAAIGVSHLVQSTTGGALYGLGALCIVLLANLTKYPALSFGPRWACATRTSLLEAYRRQGRGALFLFALMTVGTMFTIQAAVTVVTAAVLNGTVLDPIARAAGALEGEASLPLWPTSAGLLAVAALIIWRGGFRWLDGVMKALMGLLAITTLFATVAILPRLDPAGLTLIPDADYRDAATVLFLVGLIGWMPAPVDISAWNSLWTLARSGSTKHHASKRESGIDFNLGFVLCVLTAVCFLLLGTVVMHQTGRAPERSAPKFIGQLIGLYTGALGEWVRPVISASALAVMFSTTLTVFDAIPRVLTCLLDRFAGPEDPDAEAQDLSKRAAYWLLLGILAAGSLTIIGFLMSNLRTLVNFATALSVLTTPVLAWFNHRAVHSPGMPPEHRPGRAMTIASWVCLAVLSVFGMAAAFVFVWAWA